MEKELANSYNFLNQLIDSIPDSIFVKDREHSWIILNEAFCNLTGLSRDTLLGKSDYDIFPKEQADIFWDKDESVFASGKVNINEEFFTSAEGVIYFIETVKSMFVSATGDKYLVGTIRDITKRKEAEEEIRALNTSLEHRVLKRTEELSKKEMEFRTLVENLPDNIIRYDKECRAIYVSPTMARVVGDDAVTKIIGKNPMEAKQGTPLVTERYQLAMKQVIATGEQEEITVNVPSVKGEMQVHQIRFVPEFDTNGEICGVLVIGRDITKEKRIEDALRESEEYHRKNNRKLAVILLSMLLLIALFVYLL